MTVRLIENTAQLRKVQREGRKRNRARKFQTGVVQITHCGTHCKARFAGEKDFVFGIDQGEARQRLARWSIMFLR